MLNSFSQACTTFVGQNYGAGQIKRCKRTLWLTLIEDTIASGAAIGIVLLLGRFLLAIFNSDPQVIEIGYTRLTIVFAAYTFSMLYEIMSGYLRGFGVSLVPAVLTMVGVCGIRIAWIELVFPKHHNFETIMTAYPISLSATALGSVLCGRLRFPLRKIRSECEFVRFVFGKPIRSTVFGGFRAPQGARGYGERRPPWDAAATGRAARRRTYRG